MHTPGDLVNFTVTIYNDEDYPIHEVYVSNNLSDVKLEIKENKGELASNSMVLINEIPANSSVSYTSSYLVKDEDIVKVHIHTLMHIHLKDGKRL